MASSSSTPRVTIRTYQKIISASTQAVSEEGSDKPRNTLTLTCQHLISHDITDTTYDAVICGTGYDRKSWLRLLRASNLAEDYIDLGRHAASSSDEPAAAVVKLAPEHHRLGTTGIALADLEHVADPEVKYELVDFHGQDHDHDLPGLLDSSPQSSSVSSSNSPPSSPGLSLSVPRTPATVALRISRQYRLVPLPHAHASKTASSRIYLQGCAEATHGLSDTLLSVLGVRAGEVLDDLCANANL